MANGEFAAYLPQSSGYAIIIGGGFAFAVFMLLLSWLQARFTESSPFENEEFSSASRSVKPGLVCSGIVSAWTWSATLMVSSLIVYQFGVSGGWWYGVCGTISIIMFSFIASKVKENANGARTFLEIVKVRFGTGAHVMFLFYAIFTSLMVSAILLLGGSASISALTGMDIRAATMLLPVGVIAFVIVGGLRSTFVSDYVHTTIVFIIIWIFLYTACGSSELIGSPKALHALLVKAAELDPVEGNFDGSYLTFRSKPGFIYAAISVTISCSTVFLDQSYWQRAIASETKGTTKAYILGGLSWVSVPFAFGTVMGLSARALQTNPAFPTYPEPLSLAQQGAGLVAPAAAVTLLGRSGAIAMLIITYMAVTSACSAQLISVSSIFTYDVYRTYWRPKASPRELLRVAHGAVAVWGVWISLWCVILNAGNVDMNFIFYFCGTIIGAPVIPVMLTVLWPKLNKVAVFAGSLGGTALALVAWLVTCRYYYGALTVETLVESYSSLAGNTVSLGSGGVISVALSLLSPDNYDFTGTRSIKLINEDNTKEATGALGPSDEQNSTEGKKEYSETSTELHVLEEQALSNSETQKIAPADVKRAFLISTVLIIIIAVIIPIPLGASPYIFSSGFFTGWMVFAMLWSFFAGFCCIILPIWESRVALRKIAVGLTKMWMLATLGLCIISSFFRTKRAVTPFPPGPKPLPLLGNIFDLPLAGEQEWHFWAKHKQLYGPISSIQVFGRRIIILNEASIALDMFEKHYGDYSDRPYMVFGNDLVGYKESPPNLNYTPILRAHRRNYHRFIGTKTSCSNFESLQSIEIRRSLLQILDNPSCLIDNIRITVGAIILRMTYGYIAERKEIDPSIKLVEELLYQFAISIQPGRWFVDYLPTLKYLPRWVPGSNFKKVAKEYRKTLIESLERPFTFAKTQVASGNVRPSLVSTLLGDLGREPSREDENTIKWTAVAFYGAGADTSVSAISTFYLAMALFPDVQRKAQAEIDSVIGDSHFPTMEDRKRLPYIDAIVKETLRWHPVIPLGVPHAASRDNVYNGYFIPRGSVVIPNIWGFTHDPDTYHDPMEFKPERFLSSEDQNPEMDPHVLSFGFGRRICPGKEFADASLYLYIAMSLSVFNITKPLNSDLQARFTAAMLSHPETFKVDITARSVKAENLIRSVEVEHPFEASDSETFTRLVI